MNRGVDRLGLLDHEPPACGRLQRPVGYAMVPVELAELGTELEVEVAGSTREAVVVAMPFIDPKKEIPKQELSTGT
jgi:aminomethyltransferase